MDAPQLVSLQLLPKLLADILVNFLVVTRPLAQIVDIEFSQSSVHLLLQTDIVVLQLLFGTHRFLLECRKEFGFQCLL